MKQCLLSLYGCSLSLFTNHCTECVCYYHLIPRCYHCHQSNYHCYPNLSYTLLSRNIASTQNISCSLIFGSSGLKEGISFLNRFIALLASIVNRHIDSHAVCHFLIFSIITNKKKGGIPVHELSNF